MRSSRKSREAAALLGTLPAASLTKRRTTRSSLISRFTYHDPATDATTPMPDIEDVAAPSPRKRRRVVKDEALDSHEGIKTELKPPVMPASPKKRRKPARVIRGTSPSTPTTVEPPTDWEEMYNLVRQMRLSGPAQNAAVDTMGCDRLFAENASQRDKRFHILIALMLSSQTKDTVNAVAMARLHSELPPHEPGAPPGLNLENILAVEPAKLNELIHQVGFHNNKTKHVACDTAPVPACFANMFLSRRYIKAAALILRDTYASDIPSTIDGLTSLPGVGPKMAHLCLSAAWDRTEGIGVDVHVHRITNMWGWHKTTNPEATRLALEAWLPRDRWREINTLLVGLGQTVCPPQAGLKRCGDCSLGMRGLCKGADRKKVAEGKRRAAADDAENEDAKLDVKLEVKIEDAALLADCPLA